MQLIGSHMARCKRMSVRQYSSWFGGLAAQQQWEQMLIDVVGWLILNSMLTERTQFKLLCEQNLAAVWRKRAYRNLLAGWECLLPPDGATRRPMGESASKLVEDLKPSIVVF